LSLFPVVVLQVFLLPLMKPALRADLTGSQLSVDVISLFLLSPVSRQTYCRALLHIIAEQEVSHYLLSSSSQDHDTDVDAGMLLAAQSHDFVNVGASALGVDMFGKRIAAASTSASTSPSGTNASIDAIVETLDDIGRNSLTASIPHQPFHNFIYDDADDSARLGYMHSYLRRAARELTNRASVSSLRCSPLGDSYGNIGHPHHRGPEMESLIRSYLRMPCTDGLSPFPPPQALHHSGQPVAEVSSPTDAAMRQVEDRLAASQVLTEALSFGSAALSAEHSAHTHTLVVPLRRQGPHVQGPTSLSEGLRSAAAELKLRSLDGSLPGSTAAAAAGGDDKGDRNKVLTDSTRLTTNRLQSMFGIVSSAPSGSVSGGVGPEDGSTAVAADEAATSAAIGADGLLSRTAGSQSSTEIVGDARGLLRRIRALDVPPLPLDTGHIQQYADRGLR
jgi:hypothetical protein